jgi:hypothetical protein
MTPSDQINLAIAIATACSVVVSLAVVYVSYLVVKANREAVNVMREQLDASTRPYIYVAPDTRPMTTLLLLRVANTGASAAKNLRLKLDRDYYFNAEKSDSKNIRCYAAFTHVIEAFAPRAELVFHLGVGHKILNSDLCPLRFRVTAEYEHNGHTVTEITSVDLQPYIEAAQPMDPISERLDKLVQEFKTLNDLRRKNDG